jgi:hypothetical protein
MTEMSELSLPQRMLLLTYRPERERLGGGQYVGRTLNAAALQALVDRGVLADEGGRVLVVDRRGGRPNDDLEAALLARIAESGKPRRWNHWISWQHRASVAVVRDQLARDHVLKVDARRVLRVFRVYQVKLRQPTLRRQAFDAVTDALRATRPVGRVPADAAALAVLAHTGELRTVASGRERRAGRARIKELAVPLGPVPEALRRAIRDDKASQAAAAGS